eukprot:888571-Pyramimonas_sp.AAC.1
MTWRSQLLVGELRARMLTFTLSWIASKWRSQDSSGPKAVKTGTGCTGARVATCSGAARGGPEHAVARGRPRGFSLLI